MNHYIGCRNGKTDAAIREAVERSARTGKPVAVVREETKKRILAKAREMRAKIPVPLVVDLKPGENRPEEVCLLILEEKTEARKPEWKNL
jgi:hypothetical protein